MKRFSEKAAAATIARILKKADKAREALHYTWIDDKGRQCALDGFRAFRLDTPIAGLPGLPANIQPFPLHTIYEKLAPMNMRELPRPEPDEPPTIKNTSSKAAGIMKTTKSTSGATIVSERACRL